MEIPAGLRLNRRLGIMAESDWVIQLVIQLEKKLASQVEGDVEGDVEEIDKSFTTLETVIFIGGPRVTLSFGWRF